MESSGGRSGNGTLEWRVRALEKRVDTLESMSPAVVAERIRQLEIRVESLDKHVNKGMDEIESKQDALNRALIGAALSFAGGAGLFAFTIWQVFG